eukprot:8506076-Pyramimonas_sp.AAC.1
MLCYDNAIRAQLSASPQGCGVCCGEPSTDAPTIPQNVRERGHCFNAATQRDLRPQRMRFDCGEPSKGKTASAAHSVGVRSTSVGDPISVGEL